MSIRGRGEIILFFVLVLFSLIVVVYYFYKAAYRFDPYYNYQVSKDSEVREDLSNPN